MTCDETAIRNFHAGDKDAIRSLVKNHESKALGHAMVLLRNHADAADAVQEAFVDVYKALDRFDPNLPFLPWFYKILRNRCLKLLAARQKNQAMQLSEMNATILDVQDEPTSAVEAALAALSAKDREILTLKHLDGHSYKELAERLEIPIGTVMSRLYDARKRLRAKLERTPSNLGYPRSRHD